MDPRLYPTARESVASGRASFLKTAAGATKVLKPVSYPRNVMIHIEIDTTFAAGDGAAPVFDIGEEGSAEKFLADLNSGSAADDGIVLAGELSPDKALIVTATAATGTTSAGAITVTVLALP